jgi:hypothetical protein
VSGPCVDRHGRRRRAGIGAAVLVAAVAVSAALPGCSLSDASAQKRGKASATPVHPAEPPARRTPTTTPPPLPAEPALADAAVAAVDKFNDDDSDAQYAVGVYDRANRKLVLGEDAGEPMMSASVIKLYVIVNLLHQREQGAISLDALDLKLIHRALSGSDDNAMNALWSKYDGTRALQELTELAGLQDTEVTDPAQWGETWTSARDTVSVYRYLLSSLTPADRDLVHVALSHPEHYGLADGFDQEFGLLGPGVRPHYVAAKQGWLGYIPYRFLHTTGLLGSRDQYVAVILTRQPNSISYIGAEENVTEASQALLQALGKAAAR